MVHAIAELFSNLKTHPDDILIKRTHSAMNPFPSKREIDKQTEDTNSICRSRIDKW
jgi:hypothetical protein